MRQKPAKVGVASLRLELKTAERLRELAERRGVSQSALARQAVEAWLAREAQNGGGAHAAR